MTQFDIPAHGVNPYDLFAEWFEDAKSSETSDPEAMSLASVDATGQPSIRTVLMKMYDQDGFVFFTNYEGRKARQLAATGVAAAAFHWKSLGRQVLVEGSVAKVPESVSDGYFATRPRGSQIGAWASQQSQPLDSRDAILNRIVTLEATYQGKPVPRPPHWGGFRITPTRIEFWQAGVSRIHDRFVFTHDASGAWVAQRLNP